MSRVHLLRYRCAACQAEETKEFGQLPSISSSFTRIHVCDQQTRGVMYLISVSTITASEEKADDNG